MGALALVASLAAAGCETADGTPMTPAGPTPMPAPAPSARFTIDIAEINGPFSFYPSPATVAAGQAIVWSNSDRFTHRLVFDDLPIDVGTLAPGTLSQPFTVAQGNWRYHCTIHPEMTGSVTITGSGTGSGAGSASVSGS
jgi:plastocyanin